MAFIKKTLNAKSGEVVSTQLYPALDADGYVVELIDLGETDWKDYDPGVGRTMGVPDSDLLQIGSRWNGSEYTLPNPVVVSSQVDLERDKRIGGGFIFNGNEYQTDSASRANIAGAQGASLGALFIDPEGASGLRWSNPDEDFSWTSADNSEVPMTAAECQEFCLAAMRYKESLIKAGRLIKNMDPIPLNYADNIHWPSRDLT